MLIYPHAKINIGLYITARRDDGFHNIESLFYPLGLSDILEFIPDHDAKADTLSTSGIPIPGGTGKNLVLKVCALLRQEYSLPYIRIHLHKRIPLGAGLGGGSADAAFLLRELSKFAEPVPDQKQILKAALDLGSDCPFFLNPVSSLAGGRGEILREFPLDLKGYWLSVFNPGIHVSTVEAYKNVVPVKPAISLEESLKRPVEDWKELVKNSFESYVFGKHPQVRKIRDQLYEEGAAYASMSGSGSSVFSLSSKKIELPGSMQKYHIWTELI